MSPIRERLSQLPKVFTAIRFADRATGVEYKLSIPPTEWELKAIEKAGLTKDCESYLDSVIREAGPFCNAFALAGREKQGKPQKCRNKRKTNTFSSKVFLP